MRIVAIALVVLSACRTTTWSDLPTAKLAPVGEPDWWPSMVSAAADQWNVALIERGCPPPFEVADSGHDIELVPHDAWENGDDTGGITFDDWGDTWSEGEWIQIRERGLDDDGTWDVAVWYTPILLHELGHAIGLQHRDLNPPTVMWWQAFQQEIGEVDVDDAVDLLGCGR